MILVDTDLLIAHLRGIVEARDWLWAARSTGPLAVSAVTVAEITGGMRSPERRDVWALLSSLRTHPVNDPVARRAGSLRRQFHRTHSGIGHGDYLIAATAYEYGLELATLNVRPFPMFPDLEAPFALDGR